MGIITASKILTSASPTLNAVTATSVTATTTTTTSLTAGGTDTGYFLQRITYPASVTSTNFINSIVDSATLGFIQPLGFVTDTLPTGGSSMPYIGIGGIAGGTFTVSSAVGSSTALALDILFINY